MKALDPEAQRTASAAPDEQAAQELARSRKLRRRHRIWYPLGIILLAILGAAILIATRSSPEQRPAEQRAPLVDVIEVAPRSWTFGVPSQGTVQPRTQTDLVSEVSGKIAKVAPDFVAGGFFNQGDVLVQIDPSDYEVAVQQAEAALAGRQAQLAQETARAEQAAKDWEQLGRRDAPSDLVLRQPQLAEARANVRAAEADLARARRNLERTQVRAPYDGMVRTKQADIGQFVSPGSPLAEIFAVDYAEIRLPVNEEDLAFIDVSGPVVGGAGPPVQLRYERKGAAASREARIARREPWVDPQTRMQYLVARLPDPYGLETTAEMLPIGQFVFATIRGRQVDEIIVLPRHLLQRGDRVHVLNPAGELEIRPVTVARTDDENAYITDGLAAGDRVITTALQVPVAGMALRVAGAEAESAAEPVPVEAE